MTGAIDDPDEEALAWAGDEREEPERPSTAAHAGEREPGDSESMPAALLITYGIIAGVYLIYTLGWVIAVTRSMVTLPSLLGEIMFQLGEFLAIASPALWFVAVLVLTRGRPAVVRLLWLVVGLIVVVPWPFLLGV